MFFEELSLERKNLSQPCLNSRRKTVPEEKLHNLGKSKTTALFENCDPIKKRIKLSELA
jgi:hypothetical protein